MTTMEIETNTNTNTNTNTMNSDTIEVKKCAHRCNPNCKRCIYLAYIDSRNSMDTLIDDSTEEKRCEFTYELGSYAGEQCNNLTKNRKYCDSCEVKLRIIEARNREWELNDERRCEYIHEGGFFSGIRCNKWSRYRFCTECRQLDNFRKKIILRSLSDNSDNKIVED